MLQVGMDKHIRNQLHRIEIRGHEEVQAQQVIEADSILRSHRPAKETKHIYDEQVPRNGRYIIHNSQLFVCFKNANLQHYSVI
jgi:hypothetical protein